MEGEVEVKMDQVTDVSTNTLEKQLQMLEVNHKESYFQQKMVHRGTEKKDLEQKLVEELWE